MANLRELKKDIDYLVYELISDCFTVISVREGEEKSDDVAEIIADAVKLRNDMFARAKHPDGKENPQMVKVYYKKLRMDLLSGIDALFERLSKLAKK